MINLEMYNLKDDKFELHYDIHGSYKMSILYVPIILT